MPDTTENFEWEKPEVGGDEGAWGDELNETLDAIDTDLQAVKDTADAALPSSGVAAQAGRLDTKIATMARVDLGGVTGAVELDLTDALYFIAAIGGNTTFSITGVPSGAFATGVILRLTNAGAHTVAFPVSVKWPGGVIPSFTAAGIDIVVLLTDDNGVTFRGMVAGRNIR